MSDLIERGLGAILPRRWVRAWEIRAHKARMAAALAAGPVAATTLGTPDIRDQGQTNSCFGFASVQGQYIESQVKGQAAKLLSPMIPYYEARSLLGGDVSDNGSDPDAMVEAWAHYGACDWDVLPFDPSHINDEPGRVSYVQAQRHRMAIEPILEVGTDDLITAVQYAIAVEKKPVLIAIDVNAEFMKPSGDVVDDPSGGSLGYHANLLYGFDDSGLADANSWGTGWRRSGTATLTPRFLKGRCVWAGAVSFDLVQEAA